MKTIEDKMKGHIQYARPADQIGLVQLLPKHHFLRQQHEAISHFVDNSFGYLVVGFALGIWNTLPDCHGQELRILLSNLGIFLSMRIGVSGSVISDSIRRCDLYFCLKISRVETA
jgi:hypothetical protein